MQALKKLNCVLTLLGGIIILGLNLKGLSVIKGREIYVKIVDGKLSFSNDQGKNTWEKQVISHEKIIFILAYYRSGSSFTGSIFQQYPGTFYLFEPIRKVYQMFERGVNASSNILTYVNGTARRINHSNGWQVIYEEIDNWLTCNIKEISIESLLDNRQLMNTYTECTFTSIADFIGSKINPCISEITQSCRKSPIKVIKFVRLRMKYCIVLLNKYPNIKLLHLVRDPRGIFNSRFALRPAKNWLNLISQQHCRQVAEDLFFSFQLLKKYPNKVRIINFESIAEIPEKTTRDIFNFTGLIISEYILAYIKNQTNADSDSGRFGLSRHSSILTVNKWRYSLDITTARQLYNNCRKSNVLLGYLP